MIAFEHRSLEKKLSELRNLIDQYGAKTDLIDEIESIVSPYNIPIAVENLIAACSSPELFLEYVVPFLRAIAMTEVPSSTNVAGIIPEGQVSQNISVMVRTIQKALIDKPELAIENDWLEDMKKNLRLYRGMLYPDNYKRMYCAWPLKSCKHCESVAYREDESLPYCPDCHRLRKLCGNQARANGRCAVHKKGKQRTRHLQTVVRERDIRSRSDLYAHAVSDYTIAQAMAEIEKAPDILSIVPEIKLLSARVLQLTREFSGMDVEEVHNRTKRSLTRIEGILRKVEFDSDDLLRGAQHLNDVVSLTQGLIEDKKVWAEIKQTATQLSNMIAEERKAQRSERAIVKLEESVRLQKGFAQAVVVAIGNAIPALTQRHTIETVGKLIDHAAVSDEIATQLKAAAFNLSVDQSDPNRWMIQLLIEEIKKEAKAQQEKMKLLL